MFRKPLTPVRYKPEHVGPIHIILATYSAVTCLITELTFKGETFNAVSVTQYNRTEKTALTTIRRGYTKRLPFV